MFFFTFWSRFKNKKVISLWTWCVFFFSTSFHSGIGLFFSTRLRMSNCYFRVSPIPPHDFSDHRRVWLFKIFCQVEERNQSFVAVTAVSQVEIIETVNQFRKKKINPKINQLANNQFSNHQSIGISTNQLRNKSTEHWNNNMNEVLEINPFLQTKPSSSDGVSTKWTLESPLTPRLQTFSKMTSTCSSIRLARVSGWYVINNTKM